MKMCVSFLSKRRIFEMENSFQVFLLVPGSV